MLGDLWFFFCGLVGIVTSIAFVYITQYYTAGSWRPVQEIADASKTGPATNIIIRHRRGLRDHRPPAIAISSPRASYSLGSGIQADRTLGCPPAPHRRRIFGTAIATMGMLMTPPTSWRWTPSGRSPTTPAASPR